MKKRDLVERIQHLNSTATSEFLAAFTEDDLVSYLKQLQEIRRDRRRSGDRQDADSLLVAQ